MRRIDSKSVKSGMTVASDVYTLDNKLVIPKGVVLNGKTISKLGFYSIPFIMVEDEEVSLGAREPKTYHEKVQSDPQFVAFRAKF